MSSIEDSLRVAVDREGVSVQHSPLAKGPAFIIDSSGVRRLPIDAGVASAVLAIFEQNRERKYN